MSRGLIRDDVTDNAGNAIQGAQATIYIAGTLTKATLYDQSVGGVVVNNPITTDVNGVFQAFAEAGEYDITVTTPAGSTSVSNVTAIDGDDIASIEDNLAATQAQIDALEALSKTLIQPTPITATTGQTEFPFVEITDQTEDTMQVFVNGSKLSSGFTISPGLITFTAGRSSGDIVAPVIAETNPIGTTTAGAVTDSARGQSVQSTLDDLQLSDVSQLVGKVGAADGQKVTLASYHRGWAGVASNPVGGGDIFWDSQRPKSDHNGGTVFSPTVPWDGNTGSSHTDFLNGVGETDPAGLGCWVRPDVTNFTLTQFGVISSNNTDQSGPVGAALNSVSAGNTALFDIDQLFLSSQVDVLGMPERVTVDMGNCEIIADPATMTGQAMFIFEGVDNDKGDRALAAPAYTLPATPPDPNTYMLGVAQYEVTDASGIEAGDWLQFKSPRQFDAGGGKTTFEVQRVSEVSGNTIYTGAESKVAFVTGDLVEVRELTDKVTIKGGHFVGSDVADAAFYVRYFNQPTVQDSTVYDCGRFGIYVQYCCQDEVRNCEFRRAGKPTSPIATAGYTGIFGYGLIHARSCYSNVYDCVGREGWHSFDAADGQRDITYHDCSTYSDGHGFSTHEGCVSATYLDCRTHSRLPSINRARYVKYKGGEYSKSTLGATFSFQGWELDIEGVDISSVVSGDFIRPNGQDPTGLSEPAGIDVRQSISMTGCNIRCSGTGASTNSVIGNQHTDKVTFKDNTITSLTNTAVAKFALQGKSIESKGNTYDFNHNGEMLQLTLYGGEAIVSDTFKKRGASVSVTDLISIVVGSTGDIILKDCIAVSDSGVRFVLRSFVATPSDINVTMENNIWNTSMVRGVTGKMNVDFHKNTWHDSVSLAVAYNTGAPADTVIGESEGDFFRSENAVYGGLIPTSAAAVSSGFIYANSGVLTVKP